jgi:tight adherence protein B
VKRLALLALVAAVAVFAAAGAGQARSAGGISITEANGEQFPTRSYILTLPTTRLLRANDVDVLENGQPVTDMELVPASAGGTAAKFGVVLAVDASLSMKGKSIASAMAAAREFASQRSPTQPMAFVTFNGTVNVALPFTRSDSRIGVSLDSTPKLAFGTHIYDAVLKGVELLRSANVDVGSIIVVSDGADVGSTTSLGAATRTARNSHVRIFTVGIRSKAFDQSSLQGLASGTGGTYALATTKQLVPLYQALGEQLARREYLLRYSSLEPAQQLVHVTVSVPSLNATAKIDYKTPPLPPEPLVKPYHSSWFSRVISSPITAGIVILLCAALVGLAFAAVFRPRRSEVQRRLAEFVTLASAKDVEGAAAPGGRRSLFLTEADRTLGSRDWWTRFQEELEIAQVKTPAIQIVATAIATTLVGFVLIYILAGSFLLALLALFVPFAFRSYYRRKLLQLRKAFGEQLPDALAIIASALRAGHALAGALSVVVENGSDPMKSELQRVIAAEQLGSPLDDALEVAVKRMDNRDLEQLALVARLQRESGASAAEVIDRVTENVRERFELRRLVRTLTAQGRLSRWIVSFLPVALLLLILVLNSSYMHPLFDRPLGRFFLVSAAVLVAVGSWAIGRIVDIEV